MSDHMTLADFVAKVDWEGGITPSLEYGLRADHLDPNDEESKPLREAWAALETAYREHYEPAERQVSELLEAMQDEGYEGDDETPVKD
jgi:hypothetical protein